jgi:hypothetical protein
MSESLTYFPVFEQTLLKKIFTGARVILFVRFPISGKLGIKYLSKLLPSRLKFNINKRNRLDAMVYPLGIVNFQAYKGVNYLQCIIHSLNPNLVLGLNCFKHFKFPVT